MEFKITVLEGAALLAIMISGCAGTSQLDENWGRSYEGAKATQIINPEGQHNMAPVVGQPGPVVEKNLENYLKSEPGEK